MDQQVNMVVFPVELDQSRFKVMTDRGEDPLQILQDFLREHATLVFCDKDQMNVHRKNAMPSMPEFV